MANSARDRLPLRIEPRKNAQSKSWREEKPVHADSGRSALMARHDKTLQHLFVDG
jgi:hypothetical protein